MPTLNFGWTDGDGDQPPNVRVRLTPPAPRPSVLEPGKTVSVSTAQRESNTGAGSFTNFEPGPYDALVTFGRPGSDYFTGAGIIEATIVMPNGDADLGTLLVLAGAPPPPPDWKALADATYAPIGGAALPSGGTAGQVLTKGVGTAAGWADPTGGGDGSTAFARVVVVTGAEARPDVDFVMWVGGSTQPTHMGASDIWYEPVAAPDTVAPSVPAGLASSAITAAGFTLTWAASTGAATGYEVRVNSGAAITVTSGVSHTFTGVSASTLHAAQVRARDAAGNWSAWSTPLNVTTIASSDVTAPTVPAGVTISAISATGFTVSWTASTDAVGVTGYEVFVDGVSYATPAGVSQVVTGRTPSTGYAVRVRARDSAGNWSAQSTAVTATTAAASTGTFINRSLHQGARNGTVNHTVAFTAAAAGHELVMVATAPAAITTPAGWTRRAQAINAADLSVFTKTATDSEASATLALSASGYPMAAVVYEFPAGTSWIGSETAMGLSAAATNPALSGLTGTYLGIAATGSNRGAGMTAYSAAWTGATEDVDATEGNNGTTDGYGFTVGLSVNATGGSFAPTAALTFVGGVGGKEAMTCAVRVA